MHTITRRLSTAATKELKGAIWDLRAQYLESPELLLTPGQAADMTDLDRTTAIAALQALEASGFLVLTSDGCFSLADQGNRHPTAGRHHVYRSPSSLVA